MRHQVFLIVLLLFASPSFAMEQEIGYDDGIQDGTKMEPVGGADAVRFTPLQYPSKLLKVRFRLGFNAFLCATQGIWVLDDDGPGGSPGTTLFGPLAFDAPEPYGWVEYVLPDSVAITVADGDFYVAYVQESPPFDCASVARDTSDPDGRSWNYTATNWTLLDPAWGDIMIRAIVQMEDGVPVELKSWGALKAKY